jgi:phosphosulfolactate phosphohydrolase-like enzyme
MRLKEMVNEEDVTYSCQLNTINILPVLEDRMIGIKYGKKATK